MDINSHDILNSNNNADAGYIRPETAERKIKAASEKTRRFTYIWCDGKRKNITCIKHIVS